MKTVIDKKTLNELRRRMIQSNSKLKNGFDRALVDLGVHQVKQDKK
jgi:hypothetical protein